VTEPIDLTGRQEREIAYHRTHAQLVAEKFQTLSFDVVYSEKRRWWNAYWDVFTYLRRQDLKGKAVLVVGCGAGEDAVRLAKLGADVHAFDLSSEMLEIAKLLAASSDTTVHFSRMPAETLSYPDNFFDVIFARDIFHHVDIVSSTAELRRVGKPNAMLIGNEIYSHSVTEIVRRSRFVEKVLYPRMRSWIYGEAKPYITEDERKLSERDIALIASAFHITKRKFFNFIVTRLVSDNVRIFNMTDRIVLIALGPLASFCAGRIVFFGTVRK
jgi:ubiquinone/menaquinone biosynthesis C-methylase UbiE